MREPGAGEEEAVGGGEGRGEERWRYVGGWSWDAVDEGGRERGQWALGVRVEGGRKVEGGLGEKRGRGGKG